ncbi:glucose-6-phosphate isomerase [endosymbiont of Sipalinus gigas]|uniref:hypothetical protein n=1 Tax=endosymbiont of Sipalinus gigas TaxID=1972134 RepID=UPI000DC6E70B|nr:hypothetical protein [endosymbiont of Sipalinus gigas]BBA85184.1 glucose-6-phosphate isomerase [endosymbiont of Sipalinus gigas]
MNNKKHIYIINKLFINLKKINKNNLNYLFNNDYDRFSKFSFLKNDILIDYSRNFLNLEILKLLIKLSINFNIDKFIKNEINIKNNLIISDKDIYKFFISNDKINIFSKFLSKKKINILLKLKYEYSLYEKKILFLINIYDDNLFFFYIIKFLNKYKKKNLILLKININNIDVILNKYDINLNNSLFFAFIEKDININYILKLNSKFNFNILDNTLFFIKNKSNIINIFLKYKIYNFKYIENIKNNINFYLNIGLLISIYTNLNVFYDLIYGIIYFRNYIYNNLNSNISFILGIIDIWNVFFLNKKNKYIVSNIKNSIFFIKKYNYKIKNNNFIKNNYFNKNLSFDYLLYINNIKDEYISKIFSIIENITFFNNKYIKNTNYFDKSLNIIIIKNINPFNIGILDSIYEFRTKIYFFIKKKIETILNNINNTNILNKVLTKKINSDLITEKQIVEYNSSMNGIINFYKKYRNL